MVDDAEPVLGEILDELRTEGRVSTRMYRKIWKNENRNPIFIDPLFKGVGTKPLKGFRWGCVYKALRIFEVKDLHYNLMESIGSENENLRRLAISLIPATEKYREIIFQALTDEFDLVRASSISKIALFKNSAHREIIESALLEESLDVRKSALSAMKNYESASDFSDRVFGHLLGDDSKLRDWATNEIFLRGADFEISLIPIRRIKDAYRRHLKWEHRVQADIRDFSLTCVKIIAMAPAIDEIDFWTEAIRDRHEKIYSIARKLLCELDDERAIDALILQLKHQWFHRRVNAALALTNHGGDKALQAFDSIRQKNEDIYLLPHIENATRLILEKEE